MKTKTIPTILGLLVTIITTILGAYLIEKTKGPISVSAQEKPLSVKITNITDRSFVVSWYTQSPTSGYIKVNNNNKLFWDQRDQNGNQSGDYFTHYITVNDLRPKTQYPFTIFSNNKPYKDNNSQIQTAPLNSTVPPEADLAFGIILDQQKKPLPGALVFLSITNATPLSSITNESGNWSISLGTAYKKDLSGFITYDKSNQIIEITAVATPNLNTTAITNTGNDHPVPPITIGQSYNFSVKPQLSPSPKPLLNPSPTITPTVSPLQKISISNPKEGEILTNTKPEFRGLGPAQKKIRLKIESPTTYSAEVVIEPDGTWNWTPPENLEPGEHTLTLEYTDENNQLQSLIHHFIVQATETVSPTPTPITPLPTRTLTPTSTPTITLIPTSLPTATPSAQETTATQAAQVVTGNLTPLLLLVILGISLIGIASII